MRYSNYFTCVIILIEVGERTAMILMLFIFNTYACLNLAGAQIISKLYCTTCTLVNLIMYEMWRWHHVTCETTNVDEVLFVYALRSI